MGVQPYEPSPNDDAKDDGVQDMYKDPVYDAYNPGESNKMPDEYNGHPTKEVPPPPERQKEADKIKEQQSGGDSAPPAGDSSQNPPKNS